MMMKMMMMMVTGNTPMSFTAMFMMKKFCLRKRIQKKAQIMLTLAQPMPFAVD